MHTVNLLGTTTYVDGVAYFLCCRCGCVCCCSGGSSTYGCYPVCGQCSVAYLGGYPVDESSLKCEYCGAVGTCSQDFDPLQSLQALFTGVGVSKSNSANEGSSSYARPPRTKKRKISKVKPEIHTDVKVGRVIWIVDDTETPPNIRPVWYCGLHVKRWLHNQDWVWPKSVINACQTTYMRERQMEDGSVILLSDVARSSHYALM